MNAYFRRTVARAVASSVNEAEALKALSPQFPDLAQTDLATAVAVALEHGVEFAVRPAADYWPVETEGDSALHAMNRDYFLLNDGGHAKVGRFVAPRGRRELEKSPPDSFRLLNNRARIGSTPLGQAWLDWPGHRQYEGVAFDPSGRLPRNVLNLWQGWAVHPRQGDWHLLRHHVEKVISGGNVEYSTYLLDWLAFIIQRPGEMTKVAVVLRGGQGVGKSLLGRVMRKIAGQHGLLINAPSHLVGHFNAQLRDVVFLDCAEALFAGNREADAVLKSLVTDDAVAIEAKGRDVVSAPNHLNLIFTSNADWVVPASADSRRYFVLDVENDRAQDKSYFDPLFAELESGGIEAFMHHLMGRDLSQFSPTVFPKTKALLDQREHSVSGAAAWLLDFGARLRDGQVRHREHLTTSELHDLFVEWAGRNRFERQMQKGPFAKALVAAGLERWRDAGQNGFFIPPAEELIRRVRIAAGLELVPVEEAA